MAASQFMLPFRPAYDSNGKMLPGAKLWFTLEGTDTPTPVYTNAGLTVAHANPVIANAVGRFPTIYFNDAIDYRVRLYTSDADVGVDDPEEEYDPYVAGIENVSTLQANLAAPGGSDMVNRNPTGMVHGGSTNVRAALQALIDAKAAAGGGFIDLPPNATYLIEGATAGTLGEIDLKSGVYIYAPGVTFKGRPRFNAAADQSFFGLIGCTIENNSGVSSDYQGNIYGTDFVFIETTWRRVPAAPGYHFYLRNGAARGMIRTLKASGANGFFLGASDLLIDGFEVTTPYPTSGFGDDCFVIKADAGSVENVAVMNGTAQYFTSVMSIGTEVGTLASDTDPYSRYVRTVKLANVTADQCTTILYIKVGTSLTADYRWGLVDGVQADNCSALDLDGTRMRHPLWIRAARGGQIRNVRCNNFTVLGRFENAVRVSPVKVEISNNNGGESGGGALGGAAIIDGVTLNDFSYWDPYDGAPYLTANTAGYPAYHGVNIAKDSGAAGDIKRVNINRLTINGVQNCGIHVGAGVTGPVKVDSPEMFNISNTPATTTIRGGIQALSSVVSVKNAEISVSANGGSATNRAIYADAQTDKTVFIKGETELIALGELAAGATTYRTFIAPRDCWISRVRIVDRVGVAADATNKVTVTATGIVAKDTNTGFALAANAPVSINGTTVFTGATAYLAKGGVLTIQVTSGGTATLSGAALEVDYVPYGRADG